MTSDCQSVSFLIVMSRGIVLIIAALAGVLCIYLGWRLYKDAIISRTEGSATLKQVRFKLAAAGPGVFFALFGMWLLVKLVDRQIEIQNNVGSQMSVSPQPYASSKNNLPLLTDNHRSSSFSHKYSFRKVVSSEDCTQACADKRKSCLIQSTFSARMFDGSSITVTPDQADESLRLAINTLKNLPPGSEALELDKVSAAVIILQAMRSNIVDN